MRPDRAGNNTIYRLWDTVFVFHNYVLLRLVQFFIFISLQSLSKGICNLFIMHGRANYSFVFTFILKFCVIFSLC